MKTYHGDITKAASRPWRIKHVTKEGAAYVKATDNSIVCVCNADNAELIVKAVNSYSTEGNKKK